MQLKVLSDKTDKNLNFPKSFLSAKPINNSTQHFAFYLFSKFILTETDFFYSIGFLYIKELSDISYMIKQDRDLFSRFGCWNRCETLVYRGDPQVRPNGLRLRLNQIIAKKMIFIFFEETKCSAQTIE
ncbi:hypothetical protein BpHYR1_014965 [Brachionus plicatilis]|uniref:Uncharacterized protein n=1 Tax=Brachionus plicatilis TaxID=10195 RepID=A0A3M7QT69_BRAPC|nr:hypothetical protein BpHYR1_014965 [Brachionus plicatilis]